MRQPVPGITEYANKIFDLVVFSHLRWDFVWQRPQHLMSRLANKHRILFVEEPLPSQPKPYHELKRLSSRIWLLRPRTTAIATKQFKASLHKTLKSLKMTRPVLWVYSPAFVHLIEDIPNQLIVYDCMDELSAFKGASKSLRNQEIELFNICDLVFTGGKSLYASKSLHHPLVYCFPSSVEQDYFKKATTKKLAIPDDIKKISKPIVGYYGVLDERLHTRLLQQVASALPEINFVMIGPVVKINQSQLPKLPNIHYLGMKPYKVLPHYLQTFTIAWIPFVLNKSTQFISPTKTLEYMAAHTPIISTPIHDIVSDYQSVVKIASNSREMVQQILSSLHETDSDRKKRMAQEKVFLSRSSWDTTAQAMEQLIEQQLNKKQIRTISLVKNHLLRFGFTES